MKNIFLFTLITLASSLFVSCATRLPMPPGIKEISTYEYESIVNSKTEATELYDGFYNTLNISATRLDAEMSDAILSHNARLSQWNEAQYKDEKNKVLSRHAQTTEFFLSFYTPERKHNDLSTSKTLWKVYLDVNGQRYEGKATKMKLLMSEIGVLFPRHTRWSTPYILSFPIATSLTEGKPAVLTLTGAVGSTQLNFK